MKKIISSIFAITLCFTSLDAFATAEPASQTVEAIKVVAPEYPRRAMSRGVVGYVMLEYSIDERGRATDVTVVESMPEKTFDRSSIRALKASRFAKPEIDGKAHVVEGQRKLYVFDLDHEGGSVARR